MLTLRSHTSIWKQPFTTCLVFSRYEFIGQNEVSVTMDTPHVHTMSVPEGERLAVQAGDIIGLRYGPTSATRLGIPYTRCSAVTVPESDNVYWLKTSEPLTENQVYSFRYSSSSMCRIFSFRAVVNPVSVISPQNNTRTIFYFLATGVAFSWRNHNLSSKNLWRDIAYNDNNDSNNNT